MDNSKQAICSDTSPGVDRGEPLSLMEPICIPVDAHFRVQLQDLAIELASMSAGFLHGLPGPMVPALATLVRSMNCYYSNLIEGHNTHPVDIELALKNDYSDNSAKRNLQLEAKAHIQVQNWIDNHGLAGRAATVAGLLEIHQRFYSLLPNELLWVKDQDDDTRIRVIPGVLRNRDVKVGHHIPVSPGAVYRFLDRFEQVYGRQGKAETIISVAAAHHRLLWIHPFLDGNGRVARLQSHAMLVQALNTGGVWSVARGLARNEQQYKQLLANCDQQRRNDLDGRGNLSEEALAEFSQFFLDICLDQIRFMVDLMQPARLEERIRDWTERQIRQSKLPRKTGRLLEAVLYRGGELPRGEAASVLDVSTRQARRVVGSLVEAGVLSSESSRAPLSLNFPARLAGEWMPGLFPNKN